LDPTNYIPVSGGKLGKAKKLPILNCCSFVSCILDPYQQAAEEKMEESKGETDPMHLAVHEPS